jgi:hypothetical protein
VEAPGFKKMLRNQIVVGTQEFVTLDVKLELGSVNESVMVTVEVPLLETSNASNGQVITAQQLADLPNLGRNPYLMSKLSNNVVPVGDPRWNRFQDQIGSSAISVGGGPIRGNNYTIDGISITTSQNLPMAIPTIEGVQEVKTQTGTYDATMGRTGGGVFNTTLGSGSNDIHAEVFGYLRKTDWAANTFFNNSAGLPRTGDDWKNFGGHAGGPVVIPKLTTAGTRRSSSSRKKPIANTSPSPSNTLCLPPRSVLAISQKPDLRSTIRSRLAPARRRTTARPE